MHRLHSLGELAFAKLRHFCIGQSINSETVSKLVMRKAVKTFCSVMKGSASSVCIRGTQQNLKDFPCSHDDLYLWGWQIKPLAHGHRSRTPSGSSSQVIRLRSLLEGSWQGSPSSGNGEHTGNSSSACQSRWVLWEVNNCLLNWDELIFNICARYLKKKKRKSWCLFKSPYRLGSYK